MVPNDRISALAARLCEARGADLLRYLRQRLRSDADARDIAQEAYLRFIRLGDPERIDNPEAYLFRIAGNLLWEHKLHEDRLAERAPLAETPVAEYTPYDFAVAGEVAIRLRSVLDDLPLLPRAVLLLHMQNDFTCAEIGQQAGISTSMVRKHLNTALTLCRKRLHDLTLEAGMTP